MKIHHIGYLVENIEKAVEEFKSFGGLLAGDIVFDESRLVDIAFIQIGNTLIELISPKEDSEDVGKSLRRLKNTPYHICFECENIGKTIESMECREDYKLVKEPQVAVAIGNRKVAFMYSDKIGLFDLLETEKNE